MTARAPRRRCRLNGWPECSLGSFAPYSSSSKPEITTKLFASEDGTSKVARTIPEPQRLVTMLDAFEVNKFAFIFARWGPNAEVGDYFSYWKDLTRDNPARFAQIRMYWKKAPWEMAMALRSGKTFAQAASEVTATQAKQDAMSRWAPPDRPTKGSQKGAEKGKKGVWSTFSLRVSVPDPSRQLVAALPAATSAV